MVFEAQRMSEKPTYEELEQRIQELEQAEFKRKRTEKALLESEAKTKAILAAIPDLMFRHDEDGAHLDFYASSIDKLYLDPDEFLGKRVNEVLPREAGEKIRYHIRKALETGQMQVFGYQLDFPEGPRIYEARMVVCGENETLTIVRNITESKRTEDALRESEDRYRSFVMNFQGIAFHGRMDFTPIFFHGAVEEITGYTEKEFLDGKPRWGQTIHPEDLPSFFAEDEEKIHSIPHYSYEREYRIVRKDGVVRWVQEVIQNVCDDSGKPAILQGAIYDISERKRTENALQEAYNIINRSPAVAFLWKNLKGWPVEFVSDNVLELFGYTAGEFTSGQKVYAETVHPDDLERVENEVATFSSENEKTDFVHKPYRIISKDGKIRWLDDRTFIRRDNKGNVTHYEGVVVDITNNMHTAAILRENKEKLARSKKMESLGLLAGGVAHDLNNVLAGIVSYPELLLLELPENSPIREAIQTIKESGDRAVAIVQDLLTVARGVATTKEPLNLNDLIGDYLDSPEFNKLKQFHPTVTVKTNLDTDLLNMRGSHVHIRKVAMNLVSNASEAIKGSGNVSISTVNRYVDTPLRGYEDINVGEYAVLTVSDDGVGISSDDLERIFEPFYTKKVMGRSGTGLGLTVVWNIVQDHKAYIDVTSDENGTTFELFFPITREEISGKDLSIPFKDLKGDGEKILVIDDVESQRDISCKMLETFGYKTKAVSSGEEAVEYLKENTADLILLDMIMDPGINGRETYERIIKIHPSQRAIIVSGFAETDDVKETQKLGAGKYVKKPLTLEKLGMDVKEELEK
jgi:PAS domain S-box-containing protein